MKTSKKRDKVREYELEKDHLGKWNTNLKGAEAFEDAGADPLNSARRPALGGKTPEWGPGLPSTSAKLVPFA